jgi:hypothetical protein
MSNTNCGGKSILNNTTTIIGVPSCEDCPSDYGCPTILPARCIVKDPIISCIPDADTLQEYLQNIATVVCSVTNPSGNFLVAVDSQDTCPGYLKDKIVSTELNITYLSGTRCKSLLISVPDLVWNNITVRSGVTTPADSNFQVAQYAIDTNGKVHLRGSVYVTGMTSGTGFHIATLPIAPLYTRAYSNFFNYDNDTGAYSGWSTIDVTGKIICTIRTLTGSGFDYYYSLDGLSFETN